MIESRIDSIIGIYFPYLYNTNMLCYTKIILVYLRQRKVGYGEKDRFAYGTEYPCYRHAY